MDTSDLLKANVETRKVSFDLRTRYNEQWYQFELEVPEIATKAQLQRLRDRLFEILVRNNITEHRSMYEVKELEVKNYTFDKKIYVTFEYGMIGDEDTMASILCRSRYHWCIGVRGGLDAVNEKGNWVDGKEALYARCRS